MKHFDHEKSDPICKSLYFLLWLQLNQVYASDEQLGKSIKINPAIEDAYVFKDNWLSSFNDVAAA